MEQTALTLGTPSRKIKVLSCGGGLDSWCMWLLAKERGDLPDLVIFADVGDPEGKDPGEWPSTYRFLREVFMPDCAAAGVEFKWLGSDEIPVRAHDRECKACGGRHPEGFRSLFAYFEHMRLIPGWASKLCTSAAKVERIAQYVETRWPEAEIEMWIGYGADEEKRLNKNRYAQGDGRRTNRYPLMEAGLCRCREEAMALASGYPVPRKSACVYCPHSSRGDFQTLAQELPETFARVAELHEQAHGLAALADGGGLLMSAQLALELYDVPTEEDLDAWDRLSDAQLKELRDLGDEIDREMAELGGGVCPFCGDTEQAWHYGLDLHKREDGTYLVHWVPCCEEQLWEIQMHGWDAYWEKPIEDCLRNVLNFCGIPYDPRRVDYDDQLLVFILQARVLEGREQREAFAQIDEHHLHHDAPIQWKWGLACYNGAVRVGVAIIERPKSRLYAAAHPEAVEVSRVCTWGDPRLREHASSKLYGLACREAKKRGFKRVISYTLIDEAGTSLKAAGFKAVAKTKGGKWSRKARPRKDKAPTCKKIRWERVL